MKKKLPSSSRFRYWRPPGGLGTGKKLKFLISTVRGKFVKQNKLIFGCFLYILRKKWNGPPGSGAACLQVVSRQVKNQISYLKSYGLTYKQLMHIFLMLSSYYKTKLQLDSRFRCWWPTGGLGRSKKSKFLTCWGRL